MAMGRAGFVNVVSCLHLAGAGKSTVWARWGRLRPLPVREPQCKARVQPVQQRTFVSRRQAAAQYGPDGTAAAARRTGAACARRIRQRLLRTASAGAQSMSPAPPPCPGADERCPAADKTPPAALHAPPCYTIHHGRYSRNWEEATYEILP